MNHKGFTDIAEELSSVGRALRALGTANAATEMGALEFLALEVKEGTTRLADAIRDAGEQQRYGLEAIADALRANGKGG
jgi:hypothetical protein